MLSGRNFLNLITKNDGRYFNDGRSHFGDFYFCGDTRVIAAKKRTARAITCTASEGKIILSLLIGLSLSHSNARRTELSDATRD